MTPLSYAPGVERELLDAVRYYNRQRPGLGNEFFVEWERVEEVVRAKPLRQAPDARARRKAFLRRFPYKLIYRIREQDIFILAAAHNKRAPDYWETRDRT